MSKKNNSVKAENWLSNEKKHIFLHIFTKSVKPVFPSVGTNFTTYYFRGNTDPPYALMVTISNRKNPDQSVVHCWGQRSCNGPRESTRGQFA